LKPILEVRNLWKQYKIGGQQASYLSLREKLLQPFQRQKTDIFWALQDINFDIYEGECVGIIGRNGAGKSTLLKILSQITPPTKGHIKARGRVASLLEVGTGFHPELTGRENVYLNGSILGLKRSEINTKFDEIVDFSGIEKFLDTPLKHYSSGMKLRLAFSVAAHLEPEILLIDEVLAVGDSNFKKKCLAKMQNISESGRTIIFVSHDLNHIQKICNQGVLLKKGKLNLSKAAINSIIDQYVQDDNLILEKQYTNAPLEKISIEQIGKKIQINALYNSPKEIQLPSLGFVIYNNLGNPIFGSNPWINSKYRNSKTMYSKKGGITIDIHFPKLMDGYYFLSVWFGDGHIDFFHDANSLYFKVTNMTILEQQPKNIVGDIVAECEYFFT
jgi:lipopolysaccharide transport system ATP-binding protein